MTADLRTSPKVSRRQTSTIPLPFLAALALAVLPVMLLAAGATALLHNEERSTILSALQSEARKAAIEIDRLFDRQVNVLTALAGSDALARGDLEAFWRECQSAIRLQPDWHNIVLSRASDGQQLVNTLREAGESLPRMPDVEGHARTVRNARPEFVANPLLAGPISKEPIFGVRLPVFDEKGVKAVLSAQLRVASLDRVLSDISATIPITGGMMNADGTIVRCRNCSAEVVGGPPVQIVRDAVAARVEAVVSATTSTGAPSFFTIAFAPLSNWSVAIRASALDIDGLWFARRSVLIVLGLAALLAAASAAVWLALQRRTLEAEVASRTSELSRSNDQLFHVAAEVDHRGKNLLAVIQALLQLSPARDADLFRASFVGRIQALAVAHSLLAELRWTGAELNRLVAGELEVAGAHRRIIDGPELIIRSDAVQALAMIMHQLATNAVKHGALTNEHGKVEVRWFRREQDFVLEWIEHSGTLVSAPDRPGFGMRIIERNARSRERGAVDFSWRPEGMHWTFTAAWTDIVSDPLHS